MTNKVFRDSQLIWVFSFLIVEVCCSTVSHALVLPDGRTKICMAQGQMVPEQFVQPGGLNGLTGWTTFPPALIRWDPASLGQQVNKGGTIGGARGANLIIEFLSFHECAHASLQTSDEVLANCEAYRQMNALGEIGTGDDQFLTQVHNTLGPLSANYHGSGAAFWAATQTCVSANPGPQGPPDHGLSGGSTLGQAANLSPMPVQTSSICGFTSGPHQNQWKDYAPQDPLPLGSACNDAAGSAGSIIAAPSLSGLNHAPSSLTFPTITQTSSVCGFNLGPHRNQWKDYAPQAPILLGSACNDGMGSSGLIIAHP